MTQPLLKNFGTDLNKTFISIAQNKSLKSVAVINPNSGKAVNGTPNLFFVKDLLTDDNGKLLALVVNKLKEEKNEDLYFSIRDFISGR